MWLRSRMNGLAPDAAEAFRYLESSTGGNVSVSKETNHLSGQFLVFKTQVQNALLSEITNPDELTPEDLKTRIRRIVESIPEVSPLEAEALAKALLNEIIGFGPIQSFLDDEDISEVMINGPERIFVERQGRILRTEAAFRDEDHLRHVLDKMLRFSGRHVDEASPMVDARLPDGSRLNVVLRPLAVSGDAITVRKFSKDPFTLPQLVELGSLSDEMAQFLQAAVHGKLNVIISGGTGSGKTTSLNALSAFIPDTERIITIEDAAELQLQQEHLVTLETRPANIEGRGMISIRDLVRNALRMRPDRIIVGEVRGGEALDMLQAMNTGHEGSLTTIHANSPRDCLSRIETMVLMAGVELPLPAIRTQVASALDVIVQQTRLLDGSRRIVRITEVVGMESGTITTQDLFEFQQAGVDESGRVVGRYQGCGIRPQNSDRLRAQGIELPGAMFGLGF